MPDGEFRIGETPIFTRPDRLTLATATVNPAVAGAVAAGPVFVEVGGQAIEANITRNGGRVPSVALDPDVIRDIIGTIPTRPRLKVLRQSVEAGRAVERGAAVDLVLTEVSGLPGRVVEGIHPELATLSMGEMFTRFVNPNPEVTRILRAKTDPGALTAAERETVATALGQGGVTVDPADAPAFGSAFSGLQAANLFGG